eukprot:9466343-Pyramimonas_sp.AAC.1
MGFFYGFLTDRVRDWVRRSLRSEFPPPWRSRSGPDVLGGGEGGLTGAFQSSPRALEASSFRTLGAVPS